MIPTAPVPDALIIPNRYKKGSTLADRAISICAIAEPLLGVNRDRGENALSRQQDGFVFVTRDIADSLEFPSTTPLRGRPRYHWIERPDGIKLGYLTAEARELVAPAFDPIALGLHNSLATY